MPFPITHNGCFRLSLKLPNLTIFLLLRAETLVSRLIENVKILNNKRAPRPWIHNFAALLSHLSRKGILPAVQN